MRRATLNNLVCPYTQAALELVEDTTDGDNVIEGSLRAGDRTYRINKGIPRFVPVDVADDQTVKSFSQKWEKHDYYRDHTRKFYTDWYVKRYDLGDVDGLKAFLSDKKTVLDAGTGSGRDANNFAEYSDAQVFGLDTAWQALANQAKNGTPDNHGLVHADVNNMPFPDEFFDFVNCDQVIHHTPDPPVTFRNLKKKVKIGGEICTYVYRKKAVIREYVDDYVRERIKDMPIEQALEVCDSITKLGKAFADLNATIDIPEDVEILGIKKGTYDVQRFLHWNVMKCFWNDDFDFFTNNMINVDWYHPVYCFRYTPEEFRAWFDEGWEILAWDEQEAGLSCRARRTG